MRGLIAAAAGLTLCIAAGGAYASDDEAAAAAKAAAEALENDAHRLSVFSYIQDWRGRNVALPVLVTMQVKGQKALSRFCDNVPLVEDAVLRTLLSGTRLSRRNGARLVSMREPLKMAVAEIFPPEALQGIEMRAGRQPADFASDLQKTTAACGAKKG
tara:strand:- start:189 stop:662 length:474 start_codon:yes stop_codon:yes gene_type:complete